MKIKKGILSMVFAIATTALMSATVFAAPVGYSDYGTTETKSIADAPTAVVALTETKTGVSLDVPKMALPAGVTAVSFDVTKMDVSTPEFKAAATTATNAGYTNAVVFDFKLNDQNGNPISNLSSGVEISVPIQGDVDTILFYDDATGTVTELKTVKNGSFLVATLEHFSYYMMVKGSPATIAANNAINAVVPATGDNGMTIIIICGAVAVLALGGAAVAVKAKKSRG